MKKLNLNTIFNNLNYLIWLVPSILLFISVSYYSGLLASNKEMQKLDNEKTETVTFVPNSEFEWKGGPLITLWFDDGWISQYLLGGEYLRRKNLTASLAVVTNYIDYPGYMNWSQIKRVAYWGWEISSHSMNHHCDIENHSDSFIQTELSKSKEILLSHGFKINSYVAPCGKINDVIIKTAKEEYQSLRGTYGGINKLPVSDPHSIHGISLTPSTTIKDINNLIIEARQLNGWLILIFHQIDESGDPYSISPTQFYEIVDTVEKSKIPVVVPSQALSIN